MRERKISLMLQQLVQLDAFRDLIRPVSMSPDLHKPNNNRINAPVYGIKFCCSHIIYCRHNLHTSNPE